MSLLDTIKGAREEAAEASSSLFDKSDSKKLDPSDSEDELAKGFTKRSVARAKPSREVAGNVHIVSTDDYKIGKSGKKPSEMSKEERKEQKQITRGLEDRRASVSRAILEGHGSYKRSQRVWWILLGVGMGATIISWLLSSQFSDQETEYANVVVILSIILLVAAYALIVAAFIYDWRIVRPMRKAADAEVARMSDKRVIEYLNIKAEETAQQEAERAKSKEARSRSTHRHEQHK